MEDKSIDRVGNNAGMTKLFVMLVEELDAQGSLDKTLLVRRIFDELSALEAGQGRKTSAHDRDVAEQLRAVARPLDAIAIGRRSDPASANRLAANEP